MRLLNARIFKLEAQELVKRHYLPNYKCLRHIILDACFGYAVGPQFPSSRIKRSLRYALPGHIDDFQAVYDAVVLLSKLTNGWICIFGVFTAPTKQVHGLQFLKIRNHLLFYGLQDLWLPNQHELKCVG